MTDRKMIGVGFLLLFLGLSLLGILAIPNASLNLASIFTGNYVPQAEQVWPFLNPSDLTTARVVQQVGEIVAFISLLVGLTFAGTGLFRRA